VVDGAGVRGYKAASPRRVDDSKVLQKSFANLTIDNVNNVYAQVVTCEYFIARYTSVNHVIELTRQSTSVERQINFRKR